MDESNALVHGFLFLVLIAFVPFLWGMVLDWLFRDLNNTRLYFKTLNCKEILEIASDMRGQKYDIKDFRQLEWFFDKMKITLYASKPIETADGYIQNENFVITINFMDTIKYKELRQNRKSANTVKKINKKFTSESINKECDVCKTNYAGCAAFCNIYNTWNRDYKI